MPDGSSEVRTAPDGSPHPARDTARFERDVREMFGHIAAGYEWFDHVVSLGQDFLWRFRALGDLARWSPGRVGRVLDVGCGTGELSRAVARRFPAAEVVGVDFTPEMVARARARGTVARRNAFVRGTALHLPFRDGAFDLVTNAFLLRNLADLRAGLAEMHRVLAPGGALLSLEITEPDGRGFGPWFHAYFDHVVPWLGRAVGSEGPYRYLPESLRRLPGRPELLELLRSVGFARVAARPQSLGSVTAYLAGGEASR